jgi:dihydrodipicolinate synthase/N-acetylneuraminate lyase
MNKPGNSVRYRQGILVSCEIPWDENEHLMEDAFRREVREFLKHGYNDIYIFGTAGEGYAVDTANFQRIVEIFYEETNREGVLAQVGVIGLSTANVIERLRFAHKVGFRAFQISLPSWGALNDDEVMRFFTDVCRAFPDSKFLHYNLPRAKRLLTANDYHRIIDVIPNLAATKNMSQDILHTTDLIRTVPELQHFLSEEIFPICSLYGQCSLLSSYAGLFPSKTKLLMEFARAGEIDKLFCLQKEYLSALYEIQAPMLQIDLIDGAYDKAVNRLGGFDMPLRLLSPYQSLPENIFEECRKILHDKYADWLH